MLLLARYARSAAIITKPTRITNYTATLIDYIYTNNTNQIISGIATISRIIYQPFVLSIYQYRNKNVRDITETIANLIQNFTCRILKQLTGVLFTLAHIESNDLNEIATKTIRTLQLIINKHAPRKQISKTKQKQFSNK